MGRRGRRPYNNKPRDTLRAFRWSNVGGFRGARPPSQQPTLVSRCQGGTELVSCPLTGTWRRGRGWEGAMGEVAPPPHLPIAACVGVTGQDHGHPPANWAVLRHADGRVRGDVKLRAVVVLVQDRDGHLWARQGEGKTLANPRLSRLHPNLPPQIAGSTSRSRAAREWCGYLNPGAAAAEEEEGGRGRRKTESTQALCFACRR